MATKQEYLPSKEDFAKYVKVQKSGLYNIFEPAAREAAGLDKDTYYSIILHYGELAEMYPDVVQEKEDI